MASTFAYKRGLNQCLGFELQPGTKAELANAILRSPDEPGEARTGHILNLLHTVDIFF
jgi:hypothetical protein